jgi:hypothetical protein
MIWPMKVVLLAATLALALPGVAQAACPDHQYLGNYPNNRQFDWSTEAQGIAHDSSNWFFTQRSRILKLPVGADLSLSLCDQPPGWRGVDGFPTELSVRGYNHYGDPQVHGGFLFVPMESGDKTAIAAFHASDLAFVDFVEITRFQSHAGWLAINASQGLLYTSDRDVSPSRPLLRYRLDLDPLRSASVPRTRKLDQALSFHSRFTLSGSDGQAVNLFTMQGGVFSPRGDLYLMSSQRSIGPVVLDPGGISLWSPGGNLLQRSQNASGSGGFKYEFHTGDHEEPEGLDWWNRSRRPATPHVGGQLHAFLLDNDSTSDDDLYLKHYTVHYRCG